MDSLCCFSICWSLARGFFVHLIQCLPTHSKSITFAVSKEFVVNTPLVVVAPLLQRSIKSSFMSKRAFKYLCYSTVFRSLVIYFSTWVIVCAMFVTTEQSIPDFPQSTNKGVFAHFNRYVLKYFWSVQQSFIECKTAPLVPNFKEA